MGERGHLWHRPPGLAIGKISQIRSTNMSSTQVCGKTKGIASVQFSFLVVLVVNIVSLKIFLLCLHYSRKRNFCVAKE